MEVFFDTVRNNTVIILVALSAITFILFIFLILLSIKTRRLQEKYNYFVGSANTDKEGVAIGVVLEQYMEYVKKVDQSNSEIKVRINKLESQLPHCIQKFGMVRYNPFDEMGGNLCFALALLDASDNGVVVNGIHGRDGSYTYGKPIKNGESSYTLSSEELQAIEIARKKSTPA